MPVRPDICYMANKTGQIFGISTEHVNTDINWGIRDVYSAQI